jgi:hypothetical protein
MSDASQHSEEKSPFSPALSELCAALDRLYVSNNLSGRLNFRVRWPYAAQIVFGDLLLEQDAEGTRDKKARAKLEDEADDRRLELLAALETIKAESLSDGVIQMGYAAGVLERYGRDFLGYIYNEEIVEALKPSNPVATPKSWVPNLSGAKLVQPKRQGMTYQELLESLSEEEESIPLTVTFNERAYLR